MQMYDVTRIIKNFKSIVSKNSPTILTGIAVTGLISTVIMGIKATPKAISVIDYYVYNKYEEEVEDLEKTSFSEWLGEDVKGYSWGDRVKMLSRKELVTLTWKLYLPTVAVGTITIICIVCANRISLRRNAALASIYGITEAAFKEYQEKVVETIGKNKELKVRDDISADRVKRNPPGINEVILTGRGPILCFDSLSGRYFKSDIEQIRRVVNELNRNLLSDMFLTLNELYYDLGLAGIALGDQMGWDIEKGMVEISFSTQLTEEGEPCLVLNYTVEPKHIK